jgi:dual-specificity kinase
MQAVQALPHPPSLMPPYSSRPSQTTMARTGTLTAMPTPPSQAPRKRKRATNYTVAYSEIKEYDATGLARDVIVIEDSPPPATASPATTRNSKAYSTSYQPTSLSGPVRTRARAALEALAMSASSSTSTSTIHAPPQKKRKRDVGDDVTSSAKKPATFNPYPPPPPKPSDWPSTTATLVEVGGVVIIKIFIS